MAKKADLRRSKNTDLPRYVTKTARGFYLYQRRVPKGLAEELAALASGSSASPLPELALASRFAPDLATLIPASGMWVHSLGSDPAEMAEQARYWTEYYDALIAPSRSLPPIPPDPKRAAQRSIIKTAMQTADAVPEQRWKLAGAVMDQARPHGPDMERDALALFKAQAFGGEAEANLSIPVRVGPDGVLLIGDVNASAVEALPVPRPAGGDGFMFDASRAAVEARQKEVQPKDSSHPLRISQLMAPMATDRGHRQGTADGLRRKVDRFTKFAGDKPLWEYDFETIIAYRDRLRAGDADHGPVKESVVNQYIRALKMVWNYAPERSKEYRETTFPNVKLQKIKGDAIEDAKWKAFTDDQIKDLWREMQKAWGPKADTRLTPGRRKAFLMAVRVMLWTGLRPVECFHLTADNIVGDTIQIRYTKTHSRRTLPLTKHLSDLPTFLASGGFKAELEAAMDDLYGGKPRGKVTPPGALSKSLRKYFAEVREAAGITDEKQVLYSLKDTLVRRLQLIFRQRGIPVTYDTIREIIGHKTQGALAHYLTPLGGMEEGLALIRDALDAIEYW